MHGNRSLTRLQTRLNPRRERAKIADALHFVIGQFDIEMMFEPREHFERLQTINSKFLEKIIATQKVIRAVL